MYSRLAALPTTTFMLFGPRGTGKSTWLTQAFPHAERIDLLRASVFMKYQIHPDAFREEVLALPKGSWIIVDEIQKLPQLLDEIHALLFDTKQNYNFAITGSSARKIKRTHANLLAGRARYKRFFPLLYQEIGKDFDLEAHLAYGGLPEVLNNPEPHFCREYLSSYAETYLREEVQQEAIVRNLLGFTRFLQVAAVANSQILNLSNIARDVGVARSTVSGYFEIFVDTLLGFQLPALQIKAKIKEIAHPKFYWFDTGVLRTLQGRIYDTPESSERGHLFETFIINELRAIDSYTDRGGEFSYWRTESGTEVDCIWTRGKKRIGFEIKVAKEWHSSFNNGLTTLLAEKKIHAAYGVYTGSKTLKIGDIWIFPYGELLARFYRDEL
jgi:predicted AAA+ superfamily ATPase